MESVPIDMPSPSMGRLWTRGETIVADSSPRTQTGTFSKIEKGTGRSSAAGLAAPTDVPWELAVYLDGLGVDGADIVAAQLLDDPVNGLHGG